jgi:polar amino acid transport system substrate-binding protein
MGISNRIALAATAALALTIGMAQAQEKTIKIATEGAYPPYNNLTSDGKLVGFDVDIANALCEEMTVKCEIVAQEWDGMIPALQASKFDAIIAQMSITPERKEKIDFSKKYINTPAVIAAAKDTDIKGVTKEDLAGKTIGVQVFTDSTVKSYPTADEYKLDMANGRLDAVSDDAVTLGAWLETADGACCKIVGTIPNMPEIHGDGAGVGVRKGDPLADQFSAAIDAIRANGKYKEINDKYFKFDAYGS